MPLVVSAQTDARPDGLDAIHDALRRSSVSQVQEKVYIHTDNNAYFVGDTLWYKAYVVRADNLHSTDMSRILYVELLNPDGLLVERQQIIVSDKGYTNGNFHITDSLYSGYYELRAYTRWMLNFNVAEKHHSRNDNDHFYSDFMADDFFRTWDGLYSRVFPVYLKPQTAGDYSSRYIIDRPKTRLPKTLKPELNAAFYPEGGNLVEGMPCRVAFELTDQLGEAVDINGAVYAGGMKLTDINTTHMGRGVFSVTPKGERLKAKFNWNGEEYAFDLPKAEGQGVSLAMSDGKVKIAASGSSLDLGLSILCRGVLQHFQKLSFDDKGTAVVSLPALPTGVNDVAVFDADGRILADRLFFVNNHDYDADTLIVTCTPVETAANGEERKLDATTTYQPYEQVNLTLSYPAATEPMLLSVSVRDAGTDAESYDDGNIMTDLLLSSELKGFIANPAYYFASDDKEHADALDLLMMVQGWRKYNWTSLADTTTVLRYLPEKTQTVEGGVYPMYGFDDVEHTEIRQWVEGQTVLYDKDDYELLAEEPVSEGEPESVGDDAPMSILGNGWKEVGGYEDHISAKDNIQTVDMEDSDIKLGVNHGPLKKEVYVEAEVYMGDGFAGAIQMTKNGGRYLFEVPPFYGKTVLNLKAYTPKDSLKKNFASRADAGALDDRQYPDFYVKRDLFYPIFPGKYNYYQTHEPELQGNEYSALETLSMEDDVLRLRNVDVKGKSRRGRRAIDMENPVYVRDAYDLYNDITDYGLMWGRYNLRMFPLRASRFLFGNMNRHNRFNVASLHEGFVFHRNFKPMISREIMGRTYQSLLNDVRLRRLKQIRFYTDFDLRNEDHPMTIDSHAADVTLDFVSIPDEGMQVTSRDRKIMLQGFNEPARFYHRDYSNAVPKDGADHRRTLYWNPNARTDEYGNLYIRFFNNGKQTRLKVTAAGITPDGKLVR